jgi:hypothetical protein
MATSTLYCLTSSALCLSLTDWKDVASIVGTVVAVPSVVFAAYKTWREFQRSREQRLAELEQLQREHELKRVEFTLTQHRRLFDDPILYGVLRILDGDPVALREHEMWNPKRKFLTFFEEIVLLVNSGYIKRDVALYMFGYYAVAAHSGANFRHGISYTPESWYLFMGFAEESTKYLLSPEAKTVKDLRL